MDLVFNTAYNLLAELRNPSASTLNLLAQAALVTEKEIEQDMFLDQQHDAQPATIRNLKERAKSCLREDLQELIDRLNEAIDELEVDVDVKVKRSVSYSFDFKDGGPLR